MLKLAQEDYVSEMFRLNNILNFAPGGIFYLKI